MERSVTFHWRLIQSGDNKVPSRVQNSTDKIVALPDLAKQINFCNQAAKAGMDGLLVDIHYAKPDPLLLSASIAPFAKDIKFIVALRSGMINPTYFTQQINTFSSATNGRILLNIVAGFSPKNLGYYGDFLSHDERYARTAEFLHIANKFWHGSKPFDFKGKYFEVKQATLHTPFVSPDRKAPYIFIAGGSNAARNVAIQEGDCWMRFPNKTEKMATEIAPVVKAGKTAGLRLTVIIRPTKKEAIAAAYELINSVQNKQEIQNQERQSVEKGDSISFKALREMSDKEWLNSWIWTGTVKVMGPAAIAFVGTPEEFADMVMTYKKIGITQYIISGWPKLEEMRRFGKTVLPLVREREKYSLR